MELLFLFFTALCCYVLYKVAKKLPSFYKEYQLLEQFPGPPCDSKILGHTSVMGLSPEGTPAHYHKLYKRYGGAYRLWLLWLPYVSVADADSVEAYFTDKQLLNKGDDYYVLHVWLGFGLLTSQGKMWQQRRKLITPAFHFSILNGFCEIFVGNALNLVEKLGQDHAGSEVDVFELMHLVSLENICETAMGIKIDALKNPRGDYIRAVEDAANAVALRAMKPWYIFDFIFFSTPVGRKLKKDLDIIFELSNKVTNDKKNERAQRKKENGEGKVEEFGGKKKTAFLDLLLEASESQSVPLSDQDFRDEVNTFMFEGHDTTATAMSFTHYLLGLHPEIQDKCYKELNDIFQGSDRKPTVEDLREMHYLEQVIKESLRLFPSVPLTSRRVNGDTKFGKYTLPSGTTLILNFYNLHRDEKYFPDPEKFDPDRFTPEKCASRHPFAYVPFAAGTRNCIGQKFAMMEMKVVLSYVLRNFTLESAYSRDELQLIFSLVIRSQKPLKVKFIPRNVSRLPVDDHTT